jgi:hypothetical protein
MAQCTETCKTRRIYGLAFSRLPHSSALIAGYPTPTSYVYTILIQLLVELHYHIFKAFQQLHQSHFLGYKVQLRK